MVRLNEVVEVIHGVVEVSLNGVVEVSLMGEWRSVSMGSWSSVSWGHGGQSHGVVEVSCHGLLNVVMYSFCCPFYRKGLGSSRIVEEMESELESGKEWL